jgi:DNA-directed RNA polymerase
MARKMWNEVGIRVRGAMQVMKWLQDVASVAAEQDQPVYWETPSGFIVRHFYGEPKAKRVQLFLDSTEVKLTMQERTSKLSVKEQLQGIPPNFTHSIDGCCLMETIVGCSELGLTSFASVHDSYGTHAANMRILAQETRKAFVHVHEHDLLGMFRESCVDVLEAAYVERFECDPLEAREKARDAIDRKAGRLEMGTLDIRGVLDSEYFFM